MIHQRAYSLVEVLIATTVLALGLLGLIAVLAGSAVQQQTASLQNLSVGVSRNAEEVLARQLGRPGDLTTIREGQWTYVTMDDQTQYLTVFPGYLLVPFDLTTTLFDRGISIGDRLNSPPTDTGSIYTGSTYPPGPISSLRHRRIDLESGLQITITIYGYNNTSQMVEGSRELIFTAPANVPTGGDVVAMESLTFGHGLEFDRRIQIPVGKAGISGFNLNLDPSEFVNSITAGSYFWRNDQLISLTDRLVTEPQDDFPGGKRPVMSYSAIIRRTSASTQLCFFTYSCRALSKPQNIDTGSSSGLAFVPPDTFSDVNVDEGVLREVRVELGYERESQRYFFEIDSNEEFNAGWALAQGQILMMSSRDGVNSNTPGDSGADFPVRVVSARVDTENSKIQAFLDRSPRVEGRTPLMDLDISGSRQEVHVWAVQPVVKSRTDGTEWSLSAIEARVIQVADQ